MRRRGSKLQPAKCRRHKFGYALPARIGESLWQSCVQVLLAESKINLRYTT